MHKLLPGDEIHTVNGVNVVGACKDRVVELIRASDHQVELTVCQPRLSETSIKSAILSASKRARLKHNPGRVRFAHAVALSDTQTSVGCTLGIDSM